MLGQVSTHGRILGQLRPANTTAVTIYSPSAHNRAEIRKIIVCNTSASAVTFRICHDENGTTYDETTAIMWDVDMVAGETKFIEEDIWMDGREDSPPNLSVRTSVGNALTFTVYGSLERLK